MRTIEFARRFVVALASLCVIVMAHSQTPSDAGSMEAADAHALATSPSLERDPAVLGRHLGEPFTDSRTKLRAVYRWVTARMQYDTDSYRSGRQNHQSAQQALDSRKSTCDGFSVLFADLARYAGVPVLTVTGYVKDGLHQNGQPFSDTNHAWNLVQLDGQWRIIDSTWGAGFDDGVKFNRRFDPYYFLTRPEELALSHFARDPEHRVGQNARDLGAFAKLPAVPVTLLSIARLQPADVQRAGTDGFVKTFDLPVGALRIVNGPLTRRLAVTAPVTWELHSPLYEDFALLQNGVWTDFAAAPDRTFRITYTPPTSGGVQIAAKRRQDADYTIVLEYVAR